MLTHKRLLIVVSASVVLLALGVALGWGGTALAMPPAQGITPTGVTLPYSGRLLDASGQAMPDSAYDFTFSLYDAAEGGTVLWSETQTGVTVNGGALTTNLGKVTALPKEVSERKELWLAVSVRGPGEADFTLLTPRQMFNAGPTAVSALSCPHNHFTDYWSGNNTAYGLDVYNGGIGDGIRAYTYSTRTNYAAVYAVSAANTTAGNGGPGVYAYSSNGYAGNFLSDNYRALYAKGASAWYAGYIENPGGSANVGLYVNGTMWVTGAKTGYVTDAALNDGPEPLETGDVVVITGVADPIAGEIPVIRVRKASAAGSTAVAGVVDQGIAMQKGPQDEKAIPGVVGHEAHLANNTAIQSGEYLLIVTLGAYKGVKVDATLAPIQVGDLLVSSGNTGYAGYAAASADAKLNTVIGKALGGLKSGTGLVPVLVTLK